MQLTKSYWHVVAALGVVGAFVASACVVTTSTDGNTAGDSGETNTTAGSTSAGSSAGGASAGSSNTAGTGGAVAAGGDAPTAYQCDTGDAGAPPGTPSTCAPDADHTTDSCALCVQASCCTEYSQCFATDPGNQCGWGGPSDGSEIICFQQCVKDAITNGGVDNDDTRTTCSDQCVTTTANKSTHDCGAFLGVQTQALIGCLSDHCATECLGG